MGLDCAEAKVSSSTTINVRGWDPTTFLSFEIVAVGVVVLVPASGKACGKIARGSKQGIISKILELLI